MSTAGVERRLKNLEREYRSRFLKKVTFVLVDGSRVTVRGLEADPLYILPSAVIRTRRRLQGSGFYDVPSR
jgi:hypothetical protein